MCMCTISRDKFEPNFEYPSKQRLQESSRNSYWCEATVSIAIVGLILQTGLWASYKCMQICIISCFCNFRNVVFAPSALDSYSATSFTGIHDAFYSYQHSLESDPPARDQAWREVERQVSIATLAIECATHSLTGNCFSWIQAFLHSIPIHFPLYSREWDIFHWSGLFIFLHVVLRPLFKHPETRPFPQWILAFKFLHVNE